MKKMRPLWRRLIYVLIGLIVLVFAGNFILNRVIEQKIKSRLGALAPYANVSFTSAHANLFKLSVYMQGLNIIYHADTTAPQHAHTIQFKEASFTGINFLNILFNKKLGISTVRLTGGTIIADSFLLYKTDLPTYNLLSRLPFTTVDIGRVTLTQAAVLLHGSGINTRLMNGNISVDDIYLTQPGNTNIRFGNVACNIQDVHYAIPGINHTIQIQRLVASSRKKMLRIDSLQITPLADTQALYIKALVPTIAIKGFDILQLPAGKFIAEKILIDKSNIHASANGSLKNILQPAQKYIQQYVQGVQLDSVKLTRAAIFAAIGNGVDNYNVIPDSLLPANLVVKTIVVQSTKLALQQDGKKECVADSILVSDVKKLRGKDISFENIDVHLSAISGAIPGSVATIHISSVAVNTKRATLKMENIKLVPVFGKFELGNKLGHQADYIEATVAGVDISGLDVQGLINKKLKADKIVVNKADAYIFRDRRLPRPVNKQLLPIDYLQTLSIQLHVKKIEVKNSSVAYEEFPKDGTETGMLKVVDMQMSLWPLVNHASPGVDHLNNHVEASIMGSGSVSADITMPLTTAAEYHVHGVIHDLALTKLNSPAENLGKFHIESGLLNTLNFEFWLNEEKAHGKIIGEYHDLVLDKLKGNDKKKAWVPTFALKTLIIPKNKDKSLPASRRTGIIRYEHDPTRFFSFYLVKALLSGIRDSFTLGFLLPK